MDYGHYDSTVPPVLPSLYSTEDYLVVQREVTRQYHQLIAEQEIGFRDRLCQFHLHAASSHYQILQPIFNQRSRQILKPKSSKKLQQDSSRSPNSGLPERRGWCSLCEVDCKTQEVLEKHNFGKKHQLMLKRLKEGSAEGGEGNSEPEEPKTEQQQQEKNKATMKENAELNEQQDMKERDSKQQTSETEQQQQERHN